MPPQGQQTTEDVLKRLARMGLSMPSKSAPTPTPPKERRQPITGVGTQPFLHLPEGPLAKLPEIDIPSSEDPDSAYSPGLLGTFQRILVGAMEAGGSALGVRDPLDPKSTKADMFGGLVGALSPVAGAVKAAKAGRTALKAAGAAEEVADLALDASRIHAPTQTGGTLSEAMQPITAYHGSPHDFDKFSLEKIGTGEGAQAYGHGLYFAENQGVAKEYQRELAQRKGPPTAKFPDASTRTLSADDELHAATLLNNSAPDKVAYAKQSAERMAKSQHMGDEWLKKVTARIDELGEAQFGRGEGKMYEVGLHASPDDFLDWDKPLSQQSEKVRKALEQLGIKGKVTAEELQERLAASGWTDDSARKYAEREAYELTGQHAYRSLSHPEDIPHAAGSREAQATESLRKLGIKGIRYLDQGSRAGARIPYQKDLPEGWSYYRDSSGVGIKDAKGLKHTDAHASEAAAHKHVFGDKPTSNYVVFDEDIIDIRKKFLAMLAAGAGAAAAKQAAEAKDKKKGG